MKSKLNNIPQHFRTISDMLHTFNLPKPLHPLICLLDYSDIVKAGNMLSANFVTDFYSIYYNKKAGCRASYGQTIYDFAEGGMSFISPGQPLTCLNATEPVEGFTLLIHPDFLRQYPLDARIKNYGFFSYSVNEALLLSDKERQVIQTIVNIIEDELKTSIDDLSQDVLVSQLDLLLNYSQRFYKRQFITRKIINNDLLDQFDSVLSRYFKEETSLNKGLPTVTYLAEALKVSPRYLSDMLRLYTGNNTQQHIHKKLIEKAKEKLSISSASISEIAYELGFEHSQSFSKLFKKQTNQSPLEFRASLNN
ncbi:AraC-like ligand binding domain-containing protein [Pedobacter westerhofensis]|uniref:AraC-like ligand binding domain-containing protein n=1 Tax=Pedobacter westerhofensis TaxID=425512 RepID=A0A521AB09_9SPHI|nr:AraC family transcriptional regulator [Pedobacter westerhofensis]SMO31976.1 AraC-like ligand binding domain-containing protein [Pedobacter westerhofensis]